MLIASAVLLGSLAATSALFEDTEPFVNSTWGNFESSLYWSHGRCTRYHAPPAIAVDGESIVITHD